MHIIVLGMGCSENSVGDYALCGSNVWWGLRGSVAISGNPWGKYLHAQRTAPPACGLLKSCSCQAFVGTMKADLNYYHIDCLTHHATPTKGPNQRVPSLLLRGAVHLRSALGDGQARILTCQCQQHYSKYTLILCSPAADLFPCIIIEMS